MSEPFTENTYNELVEALQSLHRNDAYHDAYPDVADGPDHSFCACRLDPTTSKVANMNVAVAKAIRGMLKPHLDALKDAWPEQDQPAEAEALAVLAAQLPTDVFVGLALYPRLRAVYKVLGPVANGSAPDLLPFAENYLTYLISGFMRNAEMLSLELMSTAGEDA